MPDVCVPNQSFLFVVLMKLIRYDDLLCQIIFDLIDRKLLFQYIIRKLIDFVQSQNLLEFIEKIEYMYILSLIYTKFMYLIVRNRSMC